MISILFSIRQWLRITLSVLYLGCIAFLSLLPSNDLPEISLFPGADKIVHTCMYLGLAWLACWSMHSELKPKWYYLIILFSIGWGAMMELFQFLMNMGRSYEFNDIVSNSIGTMIGVLIYMLMVQQKRKLDNSTI
ncbi:MAG: VanZ family protein [Bacteroidia bacterium]|nr:VanZ family protein [Bacteroidia bacterium]